MPKAIKINLSQLGKGDRNRVGQDLKAYLSNIQSVTADSGDGTQKAKQKSAAK
ncbi:MAG: hypothetical protein AAGM36_06400 [Cyanobacteria bacterium J06597_1]